MEITYKTRLGRTKTKTFAPSIRKGALSLAALSIAPLIAFAVLWAALLALLGAMWLANAIGFI